jgi:hypothetical protein
MTTKADGVDFLMKTAETQGVTVASVSDGHVMVFTRAHLEMFLAQIEKSGQDKLVVFIKQPTFDN